MSPSQKRRRSPSPSPGPSVRPRRDYVALSSRASPDVDSHPSSSANTITAQPSASPRYVVSQYPTGPPSPISRPFTPPCVINSNLAPMATSPCSVGQYSADSLSCTDRSFPKSSHENTGMFYKAHDCTVTGTIVDASNITYNIPPSNQFMKDLLETTILGAEFDSSDRDPPPRCQPGTRLAVLERCIYFISNCDNVQKMRWVVGAAGVGKSAIMQSVAESPNLPGSPPASVFFSINGRNDGTKTITTLSYQLATKSDSYRQIIEHEITRDPSLLRSSMEKQFNKLLVAPFIHNPQLNAAGRVLIIIDGLDECKNPRTQQELLRLISDLCLTYPSSPLVWLIASRPEPHITSFFSKPGVIPAYEKEEIAIDSDEARADVERFLRKELAKIKEESGLLDPRWPEERDFWKVANAAGGLFAYAQTVTNYIGDWRIGSPALQLSDVLHVIDMHELTGFSREDHPMASLDALYERILSNVPDKIMINTRKLLLALALSRDSTEYCGKIDTSFVVLCNWVGLTADEAYAAVHHLRSVLHVPNRDKAYQEKLQTFHKSFMDYISDITRSGFSPHFLDEARRRKTEYALRILTELSKHIHLDLSKIDFTCGTLASDPATHDKVPLTWPVDASGRRGNTNTTQNVYKLAADEVASGMKRGDLDFQSALCVHLLITAWTRYPPNFPYYELLNLVFDETRRAEFVTYGILKQLPLKVVAGSELREFFHVNLQIRCPATVVQWNSLCSHQLSEEEEGLCRRTTFSGCAFCYGRLKYQLENWITDLPHETALVMFTLTGDCCVQVRLVDPAHDMSQWTYTFWCIIPQDVREKYRSIV